jgi:PAS domain S-box-containing protein
VFVFGTILIVLAIILALVGGQIARYNYLEDSINNIQRTARELSYTADNYLLFGESQQSTRFGTIYESLSTELSELRQLSPEERSLVDDINSYLVRFKSIFDEVRITIESVSQNPDNFFEQSFIWVSYSRMQVQSEAIIFDASRLFNLVDESLDQTRRESTWLLYILVGAFGIYLFSNYVLIYQRTLKSIALLKSGTEIIGSGDLNYFVPEKRKDEIGDLSRAFNQMTLDLRKVTTSRADLQREIAARKNIEEELKASNESLQEQTAKLVDSQKKYQALVETTNDFIWEMDTQGRYTYCSPQVETLWGYKPDQMIGNTLFDVMPSATQQEGMNYLEQMAKSSEPFRLHNISYNSKGELITLETSGVPFFNDDGILSGFRGISRDVTESKKVETALKESEQRFRALSETSPVGVGVSSADGIILYANPCYELILGYNRGELVGKNASGLYWNPDDRRSWVGLLKDTGVVRDIETQLKKKDGSIVWVLINISPILFEGKEAVIGTIQDITERKKAEAELAYRATFPEMNPNPVIEVDTAGNIVYINPAARTTFPDLAAQGDKHPFITDLDTVVKRIENEKPTLLIREINIGESWYEQAISQVPNSRNLRIYGRDVTSRKKADELKDEFIGMVSHELRTPLTITMGALYTAQDKGISEKDAQELLRDAIIGTETLAGIVENLLELSRSQANRLELNKQQTDVNEIAQNVVKKLQNKSGIHRLVVAIPETIPSVVVDPIRVERIMFNLVENAIKYSPKGGEVKISADQTGDNIIVRVTDHGPGITLDDQKKLFQSFEQLDISNRRAMQGVGLGLKVCRTLVEAHGGRIWVESEPGKGSSFCFTLLTTSTI